MVLTSDGYETRCRAKLTRARAHHQLSWPDRDQLVQSNLIVTVNRCLGSLKYLHAVRHEWKLKLRAKD